MDPSEVEFLAEKEKISIQTNFSEDKIYLIGVGVFLTKKERCKWILLFFNETKRRILDEGYLPGLFIGLLILRMQRLE